MPRSRGQLLATLDALDVERKPEWQPGYWPFPPGHKPGVTWCNAAVEAACVALECPLPPGLKANEQQAWLTRAVDWRSCSAKDAAARAELGFPTVATYFEEPHGHILMVVPAIDGSGLHAWQAGKTNFTNKPIRFAFTEEQLRHVQFFTHD